MDRKKVFRLKVQGERKEDSWQSSDGRKREVQGQRIKEKGARIVGSRQMADDRGKKGSRRKAEGF
jgi:hypothetical protein